MILESIPVGPMQANCYILAQSKNSSAVIIDPGAEGKKIKKALDKHKLTPAFVFNTHGHYDHIGGDDEFGVPVYIHKADAPLLLDAKLNLSGVFSLSFAVKSKIMEVEDGQIIKDAGMQFKVLHIPGHTPGGSALVMLGQDNRVVFTGDSLFLHSIGRWDLPGGDERLLIKYIKEKLLTLAGDTVVYPGHGAPSTIEEEAKNNPYLN